MARTEAADAPLPDVIGSSPAMREVYKLTRKVAPTSTTVLLIGETGTGKEVIAKAVHRLSRRSDGPYIKVNCGALHENLLESELFGHVRGAFTGALENKTGRFEAAHGGTIFLDEINSMSPTLQVKLLRVLQEREFERVGESKTIRVDVRVVAATNAALEDEIEAGKFREDLYHRLNVVPIALPPLCQRKDDIPLLARHFVERVSDRERIEPPEMTPEFEQALLTYDWPGNVRELENAIERVVTLREGRALDPSRLFHTSRRPPSLRKARGRADDVPGLIKQLVRVGIQTLPRGTLDKRVVGAVERELIEQVVRQCEGVQIKAADWIGINRNTLHKKVEGWKEEDRKAAGPAPEPPPAEAG